VNNRRLVMMSIVIGMLIASLDSTIMNTVMPNIVKELSGFNLYAWSFAAYMIISTATTPIYGRLSDIFGRKNVFIISIILFIIGSVLCGLSSNMLHLVIFRGVQGIGAGGIIPIAVTIAGDLFPVEQRGKIQALFTGMWGLSAIIAPMLGSFFVAYLSWRWIFYVNIPFGILAILFLIPYRESKDHFKKVPIDYIGALLFSVSILALLSLTVVADYHVYLAVIGIISLVLFFRYEKGVDAPFLPLALLKHGTVSQLNLNTFLVCLGLFGVGTYIPLFLVTYHHETTFMSGFVLLGTSIGWMVGAVPAGRLYLKHGFKKPVMVGNFVALVGGAMLLILSDTTNYWYIFLALTIQGYGFGITFAISIIAAQESVEAQQKGIATSLQNFFRNIGTAIGVTLMGAILTHYPQSIVGFTRLIQYSVIVGIVMFISILFAKEKAKNQLKSQ
jgi:EmrB/QacA subfamily drug resistance transporter